MKVKIKIINGSWTNDDVDLLPTIKLRTSSKLYDKPVNTMVTATSIAICWLKWGVMISFGKVKIYTEIPLDANGRPIIY
jgi:hypothetical protein